VRDQCNDQMDQDDQTTLAWLDELLAIPSIVTPNRVTIEENPVTIEASIVTPNTVTIEEPPKKRRQYQQKFGDFCRVCNTFFPAKTSRKKTCSDVCRSRLTRQRRKAQEVEQEVLWALGDLQKMTRSDDPVLRKKAKVMIAQIREQVIMTCEEVGIKP